MVGRSGVGRLPVLDGGFKGVFLSRGGAEDAEWRGCWEVRQGRWFQGGVKLVGGISEAA